MRERPYWQKVLISIWPTVRRIVNGTVYFILKVFKGFLRTVREQI